MKNEAARQLQAPKRPSIRFDHVDQALAEYGHTFDVQAVAFDRCAFRARLEPECQRLGLALPYVEHPLGGTKRGKPVERGMSSGALEEGRAAEGLWMPGSLREFEAAILEQGVRFRSNPVLLSAFMSAVKDEDRWCNRWMAGERSVNKIEAAVALRMALGAAAVERRPPLLDVRVVIA